MRRKSLFQESNCRGFTLGCSEDLCVRGAYSCAVGTTVLFAARLRGIASKKGAGEGSYVLSLDYMMVTPETLLAMS